MSVRLAFGLLFIGLLFAGVIPFAHAEDSGAASATASVSPSVEATRVPVEDGKRSPEPMLIAKRIPTMQVEVSKARAQVMASAEEVAVAHAQVVEAAADYQAAAKQFAAASNRLAAKKGFLTTLETQELRKTLNATVHGQIRRIEATLNQLEKSGDVNNQTLDSVRAYIADVTSRWDSANSTAARKEIIADLNAQWPTYRQQLQDEVQASRVKAVTARYQTLLDKVNARIATLNNSGSGAVALQEVATRLQTAIDDLNSGKLSAGQASQRLTYLNWGFRFWAFMYPRAVKGELKAVKDELSDFGQSEPSIEPSATPVAATPSVQATAEPTAAPSPEASATPSAAPTSQASPSVAA